MTRDTSNTYDKWQTKALKIALDERAREIELYWKRTAYSWTLTGDT
jgi:hypothetical protein